MHIGVRSVRHPVEPPVDEALAPLADRLDRRLLLSRDLRAEAARCAPEHDARAPGQGLRDRAPACPPLQRRPLGSRQLERIARPANPSLRHRHVSYDGPPADGFNFLKKSWTQDTRGCYF